tara:strand:- start:351 stop:875 length:525 start_codon:yes stop_codon:yes gene_type:complete
MKQHKIFSTPLWIIERTPPQLVDNLYNKGLEIKQQGYNDKERSNQGGYQTKQLDFEEFHPEGIEYLNGIISKTFKSPNWKIIAWWYNINPKGSWNAAHTHQGVDLVLIWYLTDSYSTLNLMNPSRLKVYTESNLTIDSHKGDIIIFPADIVHYVMPNPKETDRMSISMNLQYVH